MSKAKAYAVAIVPGGDFYQGGNPNDAEGVQILDYARPQQQLRLLQQHTIACEHG